MSGLSELFPWMDSPFVAYPLPIHEAAAWFTGRKAITSSIPHATCAMATACSRAIPDSSSRYPAPTSWSRVAHAARRHSNRAFIGPEHSPPGHPSHALICICTNMHMSFFQALADPARFQIVEALRGGERAVNDLVERMDIHQSGVSRHLRILSEAGFVQVRPDGPRRLYSLRPEPFRELDAWVTQYRALWNARLDAFGAALSTKQRTRRRAPRTRRTT